MLTITTIATIQKNIIFHCYLCIRLLEDEQLSWTQPPLHLSLLIVGENARCVRLNNRKGAEEEGEERGFKGTNHNAFFVLFCFLSTIV